MDCESALAQLELLPIDSAAALDPALDPERMAEAVSHVAGCRQKSCQQAFANQQKWDHAIAETLCHVTVPLDLNGRIKDTLLANLDTGELAHCVTDLEEDFSSASAAPATSSVPHPVSRRSWLRIGTTVAACCLLGLGWWGLPQLFSHPTLPLSDVQQQISDQLAVFADLPAFQGSAEPEWPSSWRARQNIRAYYESAKQITVKSPQHNASVPVALVSFQVRIRPRGIPGVLAVLPANQIADPPKATSLQNAKLIYQNDYISVAWTEGACVYICYVDRQRNDMQRLQQALELPPA